jgi:hypothetical protein
MTTDNFCFYLQNRLTPTGQTGGQMYSDTSPFSVPWLQKDVSFSVKQNVFGEKDLKNNWLAIFIELFCKLKTTRKLRTKYCFNSPETSLTFH